MSLFDGLPRSQEVFAQKPATLLHVSQSALHSMLAQQPGYWHWFGLMLSYKLRLALLTIEDLSLQPAAARVARRLLQLAQGFGDSEVSRNRLHVHQEQLALMLSLSRQTINQILKEMEAQNLVKLSYGAIEIVDLDRLSATLAT
jgi:CRP-like cAMP-binding protein